MLVIYNHFLLKLDFNDTHCLRSKAPSFTIGNMQNGSIVSLKLTLFSKSTLFSKVLGSRNVQEWGQNNSEGFFGVTGCDKIWWRPVPTAPYVPAALKCLAHGRGVVTSSQPSTFKRVSLVLRFQVSINFSQFLLFRILSRFYAAVLNKSEKDF